MSREDLLKLRKDIEIKDKNIIELQSRIAEVESEKIQVNERNNILQNRIAELVEQNQSLSDRIKVLEVQKPVIKSPKLITGFQDSLIKMQDSLSLPENRVNYTISDFDVSLKTNLTLDEDGELGFQLPQIGERIPHESLSTISFKIQQVPKPPVVSAEKIEVPNLLGYMRQDAEKVIEDKGFQLGEIIEVESRNVPGLVINQSPEAYSMAPIGAVIDLKISRTNITECPNLIGLDRNQALDRITQAELKPGKISERVSTSETGIVISQNPQPDTILEKGSFVDFILSKKQDTTVPNLIGRNIEEASEILGNSELQLGAVNRVESPRDPGTILRQIPEANTVVELGLKVNLDISKGDERTVPNLVGMQRDDAVGLVQENQLEIGDISVKPSGSREGTVISQKPDPNTIVDLGTKIDLIVASDRLENITGVGSIIANRIRRIGFRGIRDLAEANVEDLGRTIRGNPEKVKQEAQVIILEEELFPLMGSEVSMLLYRATGIYSKQGLSQSEPRELYNQIIENVPRDELRGLENRLNVDNIRNWIKEASE